MLPPVDGVCPKGTKLSLFDMAMCVIAKKCILFQTAYVLRKHIVLQKDF